jgi:hypothetical protein
MIFQETKDKCSPFLHQVGASATGVSIYTARTQRGFAATNRDSRAKA